MLALHFENEPCGGNVFAGSNSRETDPQLCHVHSGSGHLEIHMAEIDVREISETRPAP
jgi:hypothetical protein